MDPHECLAGVGTPVTEQPVLEVFWTQRLAQKRICAQVNHPRAHVVARAPVRIHLSEFIVGERLLREDFSFDLFRRFHDSYAPELKTRREVRLISGTSLGWVAPSLTALPFAVYC